MRPFPLPLATDRPLPVEFAGFGDTPSQVRTGIAPRFDAQLLPSSCGCWAFDLEHLNCERTAAPTPFEVAETMISLRSSCWIRHSTPTFREGGAASLAVLSDAHLTLPTRRSSGKFPTHGGCASLQTSLCIQRLALRQPYQRAPPFNLLGRTRSSWGFPAPT